MPAQAFAPPPKLLQLVFSLAVAASALNVRSPWGAGDDAPWVAKVLAQTRECSSVFSYGDYSFCWRPAMAGFQADVFDPDMVPMSSMPEDAGRTEITKGDQLWVLANKKRGVIEIPYGSTCGDGKLLASAVADSLRYALNAPLERMHLLDTGCGVASMSTELANKYGVNTLGMVRPDNHVGQEQVTPLRGQPMVQLDLRRFSSVVPPSSFDAVYCCWCLQRDADYVRQVHHTLKPGGVFIYAVTDLAWAIRNKVDMNAYCFERLGTIERNVTGYYKESAVFKLGGPNFTATAENANINTRRVEHESVTDRPIRDLAVFRKMSNEACAASPVRQITLCSQASAGQHCLSDARERPQRRDAETAWADFALSLKPLGVFDIPKRTTVVSVLNVNVADSSLESALRRSSQQLWGLPPSRVHVTSVGHPSLASQAASVSGLFLWDWCARSFSNNQRSYSLLVYTDFVSMAKACKGEEHTAAAQLLVEAQRLLRPGGFAVVTSLASELEGLQELFEAEGPRISGRGCREEGPHMACVLQAH